MSHGILITGGAGFIGSHTCLVLHNQGHQPVVLDNFDNSNPEALPTVQDLESSDALQLTKGDVRDPDALDRAFCSSGEVDGVIHFGLKAAGESVADPLRYFNPVGAHPSGRIGEDPLIPNNLFPYITQVASGRRDRLRVFGEDYPTPDGTGIRNDLHVMDLAEAHSVTLDHLLQQPSPTELTLNIGTGTGLSVLDVVHGFERTTGLVIPYDVVERRPGDVARLQACPRKAQEVLGWTARRGLEEMCRDGWAWQQANPMGYRATR